MLKKISVLALAGMLALPAVAAAGAGGAASSLDAQIAELTKQLEALKSQMKDMKKNQDEKLSSFEERAESWDLASRIQLSGDFRSRLDGVTADTPGHYQALDVARGIVDMYDGDATAAGLMGLLTAPQQAMLGAVVGNGLNPTTVRQIADFMKTFPAANRAGMFTMLGRSPVAAQDYDNDSVWTNRFRLNLRAKATENVEFKGRLAMYKSWGMQNNPSDYSFNNGMGGGPFMLSSLGFDGTSSRQPSDNVLVMDRAFVNWNNIGGSPVWFSIGRRPTTDGAPNHLRMGLDERQATPTAVMDYPFDGISVGYAYNSLFGLTDAPGRVRVCYGRGFEAGPDSDVNKTINDVDFIGVSWDIYKKADRFFYLQSFAAMNMFNVPDGVKFVNPIEYAAWEELEGGGAIAGYGASYDPLNPQKDLLLGRANLGNIYHTSGVYMDKYQNLNYFLAAAWSRTDAQGMDEMGTSLLGSWWDTPKDKDGVMIHLGARYDIPNMPLKIGAEFNHGSKDWIAFTPGHDDMFQSKLATRGQVYEVYGIWDIPSGEAVSKYGKAFMRLGYQHYKYDYTGSGFWLGEPKDIDELASDPLNAQFYTPIKDMDQVYVTFEAFF